VILRLVASGVWLLSRAATPDRWAISLRRIDWRCGGKSEEKCAECAVSG